MSAVSESADSGRLQVFVDQLHRNSMVNDVITTANKSSIEEESSDGMPSETNDDIHPASDSPFPNMPLPEITSDNLQLDDIIAIYAPNGKD
jgi:hypothetical protein